MIEETEEKNNKKISLKLVLCILFAVFIIAIGIGIAYIIKNRKPIEYLDTLYYGEMNSTMIIVDNMLEKYDKSILRNYNEYEEFINNYNLKNKLKEADFTNNYYVIVLAEDSTCQGKINGIKDVEINNSISIVIGYNASCGECSKKYFLYLVPIEKTTKTKVNYEYVKDNNPIC